MSTDAVHNVLSVSLPIRLADGPLAVEPCRLDRVQPRTPRRKLAGDDAHATVAFRLGIVLLDPAPNLLADVPGGVVPDEGPDPLAAGSQMLAHPGQEAYRDVRTGRPLTKRTSLSEAPEDASPPVSDSKTP